jgi:hypothetical protein
MATIQKVSGIDFANISKFDGVDISSVGSINLIGKPVTGSLLLDQSYGSGAEAAYSVRKLRTAYTGAAMQVQATSGGATAEIGFSVDNNLDTATLLAFAGTNEVRVSIWYDQSGNGNDGLQPTVGNRPIIVNAGGTISKSNGRPILDFNQGDHVISTAWMSAVSPLSFTCVYGHKSNSARAVVIGVDTAIPYNPSLRIWNDSGGKLLMYNFPATNNFTTPLLAGDRYLVSGYASETSASYYKDGTGFPSNPFAHTNTTAITDAITIGSPTSYNPGQFESSEVIAWLSDKSGTDKTSIEENIGDYYTENKAPYLLDTYTGSAAAYSLRLLRTAYTGFAIKVQDNVGGATQDIGFNVFGELDTTSLAAYGGSNDVFVETWYDQSGNGNNSAQATSTARPKIYDGATGAVITENGNPAVSFDGANDTLQVSVTSSDIISTNAENTLLSVMSQDSSSVGNGLVSMANPRYVTYTDFNGTLYYDAGNNGTNRLSVASPSGWDDTQHLLFWSSSLTLQQITVDGTQLASNTSQSTVSSASTTLIIGTYTTAHLKGLVQEIVLYPSDESANRTGIETNIGGYYDIPLAGLLDTYSGAAAGYSLRRLSSTYTGSAIKVQDNVGGATLDVGFDNYGELDTAAIVAYGGSNDVFVETFYDQSGSGNNATQATSTARPKIYDGATGAVLTENGKPAVQFTLDTLLFDSSINNTASTIIAIAELYNQPLLGNNASRNFFNPFGTSIWFQQGGGKDEFTGFSNADQVLGFWYRDGSNPSDLYENGAALTRSVSGISNQVGVQDGIGTVSGRPFSGFLQELIIYGSDESTNRTGIETNINTFYSIY